MTEEFLKEKYLSLLQQAKEKGELTSEQYEELIFEPIQTLDEQEEAYTKLEYNLILNRILKGSEYIDSITPDHPKYKAANEKYNKLLKRLEDIA
jgi:transcriptional regulator NrdR family protein